MYVKLRVLVSFHLNFPIISELKTLAIEIMLDLLVLRCYLVSTFHFLNYWSFELYCSFEPLIKIVQNDPKNS